MTRVGIERCDSPLEWALAEALTEVCDWEWRRPDAHPWEVGIYPGWCLALLAQPTVGPYRLDFAIMSKAGDDDEVPPFLLDIEVDGHDFHERTKAQARRDRARDRFFTTRRGFVLRFTGQEVYEDAEACAVQVIELATSLQQENLSQKFTAHLERAAAEQGFKS